MVGQPNYIRSSQDGLRHGTENTMGHGTENTMNTVHTTPPLDSQTCAVVIPQLCQTRSGVVPCLCALVPHLVHRVSLDALVLVSLVTPGIPSCHSQPFSAMRVWQMHTASLRNGQYGAQPAGGQKHTCAHKSRTIRTLLFLSAG